ncbi:hypothetical protein SLA2020_411580 [Shorea laevis]
MGKSQVCSTEDAVHALLDYLVEPLLPPAESTKQRTPSESRQLSVAKQWQTISLGWSECWAEVLPLANLGKE